MIYLSRIFSIFIRLLIGLWLVNNLVACNKNTNKSADGDGSLTPFLLPESIDLLKSVGTQLSAQSTVQSASYSDPNSDYSKLVPEVYVMESDYGLDRLLNEGLATPNGVLKFLKEAKAEAVWDELKLPIVYSVQIYNGVYTLKLSRDALSKVPKAEIWFEQTADDLKGKISIEIHESPSPGVPYGVFVLSASHYFISNGVLTSRFFLETTKSSDSSVGFSYFEEWDDYLWNVGTQTIDLTTKVGSYTTSLIATAHSDGQQVNARYFSMEKPTVNADVLGEATLIKFSSDAEKFKYKQTVKSQITPEDLLSSVFFELINSSQGSPLCKSKTSYTSHIMGYNLYQAEDGKFARIDESTPLIFNYTHTTANDRDDSNAYDSNTYQLEYFTNTDFDTGALMHIPQVDSFSPWGTDAFGIKDGTALTDVNGNVYHIKASRIGRIRQPITGEICEQMFMVDPSVENILSTTQLPSNANQDAPNTNGCILDSAIGELNCN